MAVKMMRWTPWPPASAAGVRRFRVGVKPARLDGFGEDCGGGGHEGSVAVKVKWKGEPRLFPLMAPFQSRPRAETSSRKTLEKGLGFIEWDEDGWFENICCLSVVSDHDVHPKFGAWEITFSVLHSSEKMDSKAKTAVIGRVSVNISEIAARTEKSSIEQKLPLSLQIDGVTREAFLTVLFNFVEIRDSQEPMAITRAGSVNISSTGEEKESVKARRRSLSQEEEESLDESDDSSTIEAQDVKPTLALGHVLTSDKKEGWFSWKNRRFYTFKRAKTKEEKFDEKPKSSCNSFSESKIDIHPKSSSTGSEKEVPEPDTIQDNPEGSWEQKELVSRDGQSKLTAPVFLASFDQRSPKAAGEGACTALVAVISHWLLSNPTKPNPNRPELDSLIIHGSSEWQKLCRDTTYLSDFTNCHFDLDTVLRARIRPVSISPGRSFVGFFGADRFESLKGAMSFDDIWNEITTNIDDNAEPGVYIVSWNDHFFVLKVDSDAYYVIDTLGERLFEGCDRAYVLRFDKSAVMTEIKEEKIICSGKECCREFIKRFLAAIPLKELEDEERKNGVSYFSLHHRLQIEFNYSCLLSSFDSSSNSSSLMSSPFSSSTSTTNSMSSPL
ncbi:Unknown protein [Striga hermonthica]|uniref:C2 NT-type domain-containing protein n=1 Tax=Striga hermonthica TaxID=68872 RepID=A0A9N7N4X1_STRHE|nr:Unknown protein [Striga hermonthica]